MTTLHIFRPETRGDNGTETPGPGVYPNTPMDVYHRWNAASNSRLTKLDRSPAHLKAYLDEPPEETAALKAGRAIHCAVLEPDDFDKRYVVAQQCEATTKKGEQCSKTGSLYHPMVGWRCGTHPDDIPAVLAKDAPIVIKDDDHAMCLGIRDALHVHSSIKVLLAKLIHTELSVRWTEYAVDGSYEVACKARFDGIAEFDGGMILDLKSTADARKGPFERSIFSFGYHRQGPFYLSGAKANLLPVKHYVLIPVEKEPPYACAAYRLKDDVMRTGELELDRLLQQYDRCMRTGEFPGYPETVEDIGLPAYAFEQIDEKLFKKGA